MNKEQEKDTQLEWFRETVKDKLRQFYNDYTVVDSYVEDYDRDGEKRTVECVNRWLGWSWELESVIKKEKNQLYEDIVKYGIINDKEENIKYPRSVVYEIMFGKKLIE